MRTLAKLLSTAVALTALSASGAPALAKAPRHPPCTAAGRHLIRANRLVVVYERLTNKQDGEGGYQDGVYACARPSGRSYLIGYDDLEGQDGEYGPQSAIVDVRVAGRFVAVQFVTGADEAAACSKYTGDVEQQCPSPQTTIHVMAADTGRSTSIALKAPDGGAAPAALSSGGALAWIDNGLYAVRLAPAGVRSLRHQGTLLDPGPIDAGSLKAGGLTVSWTTSGQPHSSALA